MPEPASKPRPSYRTGARLVPMRSSDSSRDFILEQLGGVRELIAKAMFGGLGLYSGGVFFGLVARDRLYLKVDDSNRARFEQAGSAPFKPYADRAMTMNYWEVPAGVLEDADALLGWARASIAVAQTVPPKAKRLVASPSRTPGAGAGAPGKPGKAKAVPARRRAAGGPRRKRSV